MVIKINKFGSILVSRPAGKEAYLAYSPTLRQINNIEKIVVDFEGVEVLTPSWADEFITPLLEQFTNRVSLINTDNPSVKESLRILNIRSS